MLQRAIPASGKLVASAAVAALAFLLLAIVGRMRNVACNPRLIDTVVFKDTSVGRLMVNAVTGLLYAVEDNTMDIAVFDVDNLDHGPLVRVPTEGYIHGIAVDERANKLYVVQQFAHRVRVVDGKTHTYHDIDIPDAINAIGSAAVDPEHGRLYVTRLDNHDIAVFDTSTEAFLGAIDDGCCPHTNIFLAVDPLTGLLYVLNQTPPQVSVFDTARRKIAAVAVGDTPGDIALDPLTHRAYVANGASQIVSAIDTDPGSATAFKVVDDIVMREHPAFIAIDSAARRAYVTNTGTDSMAVIDLARSKWMLDMAGVIQPGLVAFDPVTARVFTAMGHNEIAVVQGCSAPRWPWQAPPARTPVVIATPPPMEPTAAAQHRLDVRCARMFKIRTQCSDGPEVHEARLALATVEAAGARVVEDGAAGRVCGVEPNDADTDLAAAGFFYSVPVVEPGADAPVVWTFQSTFRTFAVNDAPVAADITRVADPPDPPWAEALWYLSRYKTGHAPEAVAGCE